VKAILPLLPALITGTLAVYLNHRRKANPRPESSPARWARTAAKWITYVLLFGILVAVLLGVGQNVWRNLT